MSRRDVDDEEDVSSGYSGSPGGFPGAVGGIPGIGRPELKGPLLADSEKERILVIDRTDFVVQFVWIPTLEKARLPADPRSAIAAEGAAAETKKK